MDRFNFPNSVVLAAYVNGGSQFSGIKRAHRESDKYKLSFQKSPQNFLCTIAGDSKVSWRWNLEVLYRRAVDLNTRAQGLSPDSCADTLCDIRQATTLWAPCARMEWSPLLCIPHCSGCGGCGALPSTAWMLSGHWGSDIATKWQNQGSDWNVCVQSPTKNFMKMWRRQCMWKSHADCKVGQLSELCLGWT